MEGEVVFHEPNSQTIKMFEVILEFAEDMLKHSDTRADKKKAIDLACIAWNLALFKEKSEKDYEIQFHSFFKQMDIRNKADQIPMKLLIDANALIDKKMNEYADINRLIVDYQIDFVGEELTLNVASTISPEEIEE